MHDGGGLELSRKGGEKINDSDIQKFEDFQQEHINEIAKEVTKGLGLSLQIVFSTPPEQENVEVTGLDKAPSK